MRGNIKDQSQTESRAEGAGQNNSAGTEPSRDRVSPIVGIGASAGGLEALKAFFSNVPENSGMAYVVVVHMAPKQPSMLADLLQRVTRVPVTIAKDGEFIYPDHVYVIPPDKDLGVYERCIQLLDTVVDRRAFHPIDFFLRSLAGDQRANAVAVVLSGTGTDGTLGVKEIKAFDGLVLAQSEGSAGYGGMPASAVSTGVVDLNLAPEEMPVKIIQYFQNFGALNEEKHSPAAEDSKDWLSKVLSLLRTLLGHDFSLYKKNTIVRRARRRMSVNQIGDPALYVRFMRENPKEAETLFRELLIGVTHFFRDSASFETLKKDILPRLLAATENDSVFRVWVPGCSTGEEAYSLAMVFHECMDGISKRMTLQLFGTDIDKYAIDKAREGLFPESIAADVSPQRLGRFFVKEQQSFRIRKEVRDSIVFSVQDVLKDPPFSRLNLLCCRNLLIYLNNQAQKKLLPLFHYTLVPGGILVLGPSESIGGFSTLFHTLDNKWKIFQRREVPPGLLTPVEFPVGVSASNGASEAISSSALHNKADLGRVAQREVLEHFSPSALLVDAKGTILHVVGRTGKYLESTSGPPTLSVFDMAREGLRIEISSALRAAESSARQVTRQKVRVKTNGEFQTINLHVRPMKVPGAPGTRFLIVFEDTPSLPTEPAATHDMSAGERDICIHELEKELQSTRENHQTTIEELESSNEELKSICEELQSSNEELQSTNEELESSKEELQSVNEELQTVNAEFQSKIEELSTAHDDLRNLLNSTEIATIFVDNTLRIKRFTQEATTIVNLIASDIGRPLRHVVSNLTYEHMIRDLAIVIDKLVPTEAEVQTRNGNWYKMRVMPYRTTDNRIDGAVLTFSNINDQKSAQERLKAGSWEMEESQILAHSVFDMNQDPQAVVDRQGGIIIANTAFCRLMGIAEEGSTGNNVLGLVNDELSQANIRNALGMGEDFYNVPLEIHRPDGKKRLVAQGQRIVMPGDRPVRIWLHFTEARAKGDEDAN